MRPIRVLASLSFGVIVAAAVAGCGGSSPSASPSTSGSPSMSPSTSPTTPFQRVTPTPSGAQNLPVTDAIRAQLVAAGAAEKHLKASDFVGLVKGSTYYAFDPATNTYWAGAALKPSASSVPAQVSTQDDGSYTLFHRSASGTWSAIDTAMAAPNGPADGTPCTVAPPADVLAAWGWPAHSCHPTGV